MTMRTTRSLVPLASFLLALSLLLAACGDTDDASDASNDDSAHLDRMAREHADDSPDSGTAAAWMEPAVPVNGERVEYATIDGKKVSGYLAAPASPADSAIPAVIAIHEWWGLNENMEAMARRIAGEGYRVLAVDLYNGEVATTPEQAKAASKKAGENKPVGVDNLRQAIDYLKAQGAASIGVIGWCFGGGWSLTTATSFPEEIDAAVIYYGHVSTDPAELKKVSMPLLGIFGEKDTGIPIDHVNHFAHVLDSLGADATIEIYPNAEHAFANPSGERYNAEAAVDAWGKTAAFLKRHLGGAR